MGTIHGGPSELQRAEPAFGKPRAKQLLRNGQAAGTLRCRKTPGPPGNVASLVAWNVRSTSS